MRKFLVLTLVSLAVVAGTATQASAGDFRPRNQERSASGARSILRRSPDSGLLLLLRLLRRWGMASVIPFSPFP